jgi:hypothetical protein
VHHELCADSKRDWGKASIEWGVLSVDEKRLAISRVRSRLGRVFGAEVSDKAIGEGITQRLYHLRRDWQEKSKLAVQPGSASTPSEAEASEAAATQNTTKQKGARFFDPARDLNKEDDP